MAARKSSVFARIIVSTDDQEIAALSRSLGAEVPFRRPADLARDSTPGMKPIIHELNWLARNENGRCDYLMVLQPTSPLRTAADISAALELGVQRRADAVVSVSVMLDHPYWAKRITRDGRLHDFLHPRRRPPRRQDLPAVYRLNGAIYLARPDVLLRRRTFYTPRTYAYVMPPERSIDIDDDLDLSIADHLLRRRGRGHD